MSRVIVQPEPWAVFNEFDKQGLLLNLLRIRGERNAEYKQRLFDVFVNRAGSTYRGLINGITRELGLHISDVMIVSPVLDSDGDPLLANPAIEFLETKCTLYSDFIAGTVLLEIDRFEPGGFTLSELQTRITDTGYFIANLTGDIESQKRSMTIFNQSSVIHIPAENISGAGSVIVLKHNNLIEGSISVRSNNLGIMVDTEAELVHNRTYLIKYKEGMLVTKGAPAPGSFIRYAYRDDNFIVQASPIILHSLQSTDFKTKMFAEDGEGLPTRLGATILNELMSVYPANWGR